MLDELSSVLRHLLLNSIIISHYFVQDELTIMFKEEKISTFMVKLERLKTKARNTEASILAWYDILNNLIEIEGMFL